MEPWFGNHGNDLYRVRRRPRPGGASMEPWFGNHGNGGLDWSVIFHHQASMEPWFGNHGNAIPCGLSVTQTISLQWSRGSVTTET